MALVVVNHTNLYADICELYLRIIFETDSMLSG